MRKTHQYQTETMAALDHLRKTAHGTVAEESMRQGYQENEPLLVAMDSMIRYAKAYRNAYDSRIGEDGVLGCEFFAAISGLRRLLNGQGAVAMERDISTDSKDNGTLESLYWTACDLAGIDGDTGKAL